MGLWFSHGKASWGYTGFYFFRKKLAEEIGIVLDLTEGFQRNLDVMEKELKDSDSEWYSLYPKQSNIFTRVSIKKFPLKWDNINDPIVFLINHSDCDGYIECSRLPSIASRLRELVSEWDDGDYDKKKALELADGMDLAFSKYEDLVFL